ncbi:DNA cytosine methyltransferase [Arthrobacter rhombi]|uniref:DNA cytosine methyltransferase n=1 Tax=Arthrobacter rhombi TaxID=71253 RepID=UPI003FD69296
MKHELRAIEICAGAGGQSLGLERAGFGHELAVELDDNAVATLRSNRPKWNVVHGDVADPNIWDPADYAPTDDRKPIDLFAGGVPCPPFSVAGKQMGSGDERDLFAWAVEQVGILRPRAVLLENVRGLSAPRFAGYRQHVLDRFHELGYEAEWRLLYASDFGVPQLRPRFVLVALKPADFKYFHWPVAQSAVRTVGQVLLPMMSSRGWTGAEAWAKSANKIAPTIVGGSKKHGGPDLGPTRAKAAWASLGVDARGVANEAPGPGSNYEIGPKLTNEMVAQIQGWDNKKFKWHFEGKKTSVYRQIGNAFPPPVAYAIGKSIVAALAHDVEARDIQDLRTEIDPLYKALRGTAGFLTSSQLLRRADISLDAADLDKRLALLEQDFEIEREKRASGIAYRIGAFKGFVGQVDHARHDFYKENVSKVS